MILLAARLLGISFRRFAAAEPPKVLATVWLPRSLLQVLFLSLVAVTISKSLTPDINQVCAVSCFAATTWTVINLSDVVTGEVYEQTTAAVVRSRLPLPVLYTLWSIPYIAVGAATALVCSGVAIEVAQRDIDAREALSVIPLILIACASSAALGLCSASAALGRRSDVVVSNLVAYLLLVFSGTLKPIRFLHGFTRFLPLTNSVDFFRGREGLLEALASEAATGVLWYCAFLGVSSMLQRRSLSQGTLG